MTAPLPPADLAQRKLRSLGLPVGHPLHRFHSFGAARHSPLYFDRSLSGRLNAPDGRYGVLYAAKSPAGAFAETFLRAPGKTVLDGAMVAVKAYAELALSRRLALAMVTGPGLAVMGATAEVTHGGLPYDVPQSWSSALFDHPAGFDGIAYRARHDDAELCYALFDRAADAVAIRHHRTDLDTDWFWDLAARYEMGLAPGGGLT